MKILKLITALVLGAVLLFIPAWIGSHIVWQVEASGIAPAIIPANVPTANKTGNGSKFQIGTGTPTSGNCAQFDASLNIVDAGAPCGTGAGGAGATLFSSTTQAGPANSAVETSLIGTVTGSKTIAANTFTDGVILEVRGQGFFSLPATADSLTIKAKCGSTVLASASFTPAAGALTDGTFRAWLMITAIGSGAGGAFMTNGLVELSGSALASTESKVLNTSNVAFNFTTACAFDLTAQWGAAQVGESMTGTNVAAWMPGAPVTSVNGATGAVTTVTSGAYSSLPSAGNVGQTYACTDCPYSPILDNGASWDHFLPGYGLAVLPPAAGWTWANQASATATTDHGALYFYWPASGVDNLTAYTRTLPALPVTIIAAFSLEAVATTASCGFGPVLSDGTKFQQFELTSFFSQGLQPRVQIQRWTDTATPSTASGISNWNDLVPAFRQIFFMKIVVDNTNSTFSYSQDGQNWYQVLQESRTTFQTPTLTGVGMYNRTSCAARLLYWSGA